MIDRRDFLATGAAALAVVGALRLKAQPRYRMGLQLFTVRRPLAADLTGTLKQVAALRNISAA